MKLVTLVVMGALTSALSLGCSSSNGGLPGSTAASDSEPDAGVVPLDDPEIDYSLTKTITMDAFTVPAGGEVYYCQNFANPWGSQVDIKAYSLDMSTGSHHMFAFYQPNATDGAVAPCPNGGLTFGAFTFTAQSPHLNQVYPSTVGATLPATTGFQMMAHYLNTSATTITAHVALTVYGAKQGVVTQHAGVLYLNDALILVPPGESNNSSSYTLTQDVTLLTTGSHMHQQGINFISQADGQTLYQTDQWSEPPGVKFDPPMVLKAGTKVTWSCLYNNTTDSNLTFGESAKTNVMCISVSTFYPVMDINNPVIGSAVDSLGTL